MTSRGFFSDNAEITCYYWEMADGYFVTRVKSTLATGSHNAYWNLQDNVWLDRASIFCNSDLHMPRFYIYPNKSLDTTYFPVEYSEDSMIATSGLAGLTWRFKLGFPIEAGGSLRWITRGGANPNEVAQDLLLWGHILKNSPGTVVPEEKKPCDFMSFLRGGCNVG